MVWGGGGRGGGLGLGKLVGPPPWAPLLVPSNLNARSIGGGVVTHVADALHQVAQIFGEEGHHQGEGG